MSLSVRQIATFNVPMKNDIDAMQKMLEDNQDDIYFLQDKMKSNTQRLLDANAKTTQRIEDKNNLLSNLTQLDDALSCFTEDFLTKQHNLFASVQSTTDKIIRGTASVEATGLMFQGANLMIDVPHPYFHTLLEQYTEHMDTLKRQVEADERALLGYAKS